MHRRLLNAGLVIGALALAASPAFAALDPYDPPMINCEGSAESGLTLMICAGATTGTPAGLTLQWKKLSDWEVNGWNDMGDLCRLSLSGQPSLQHFGKSRWELLPGECETIDIGDILFDETGVSGEGCALDPLECGTQYVFRAFSHAGRGMGRSAWTEDLICSTLPCPVNDCTFTQGYWKTHGTGACHNGQNPNVWPVTMLHLGNPAPGGRDYTQDELCAILNKPAAGNCLISLAHQLITAKLNVANGAVCAEIDALIAQVDAHIGNRWIPPVGTGTMSCNQQANDETTALDTFNKGGMSGCPAHCNEAMAQPLDGIADGQKLPWGALKIRYR